MTCGSVFTRNLVIFFLILFLIQSLMNYSKKKNVRDISAYKHFGIYLAKISKIFEKFTVKLKSSSGSQSTKVFEICIAFALYA